MQPQTAHIDISDEVLIKRWQSGDLSALENLIIKYKDRIYNTILRICSNRDTAAELLQDTFVKVIENAQSFKGKSTFYTWCFRIAVNITLNWCRKNKSREEISLDVQFNNDHEQAKAALRNYLSDDNSPNPLETVQNKEQVEILLAAIGRLDEDQRTVLVLRDIENMNYNDISLVLGTELGTVKSRLSRARANLRQKLEGILQ
ncbi:MAG: sigma-70 family RNA polymerase sigma factor [Phycisphaerae bacterium]